MKTLIRLVICVLFLTVSKATAQETFAPLISENCVAFVHVDLRKVELDNVKDFLQKTGEDFLTALGFDERSHRATARELTAELEKLDILVRPTFDTITKELGIRELAFIMDLDLIPHGMAPFVWAIPWKDKTDKDFETFLNTLTAPFGEVPDHVKEDAPFVKVDGFLLVPVEPWGKVADWAKTLTPAKPDSPIFEALQSVAGAEIKVAFAMTDQVRTMIRDMPLPMDVPDEVKNLLTFASQRIDWASASISLAPFLGTEPPENPDVLMTLKMARAMDARQLRRMLDSLIELGANSAKFMIDMEMQNEDFKIPPVAWQFAKGLLRTLLPDVEEDRLIFRIKADFGSLLQPVIAVAGGSLSLFVTRNVQDQQARAQRMSAFTHVKMLEFAVEHYTLDVGHSPTTAQGLMALIIPPEPDHWAGPYIRGVEILHDPWGNEYRYAKPGGNNRDFDIWSLGPDGINYTEDDIGNWMPRPPFVE